MNQQALRCWCGNAKLEPYGPDYFRCPDCTSLVSKEMASPPSWDELRDMYGSDFWERRQQEVHGYPDLELRARADLPERDVYWLRALLKYRRPPARILEIGSAHGGFVRLMRTAGFDASGLELSPWVIQFAEQTFGVSVCQGPVEDAPIEPASLDVIVMMDVIEHLTDPERTIRRCRELLRPSGAMLVQTPEAPAKTSFDEIQKQDSPFYRAQMVPDMHLYLYSRESVAELFRRAGIPHLRFEEAIFSCYDMFFLASLSPVEPIERGKDEPDLELNPENRLVQALLDSAAGKKFPAPPDLFCEERAELCSILDEQRRRIEALEDQIRRVTEVLEQSEGGAPEAGSGGMPLEQRIWAVTERLVRSRGELLAELDRLRSEARANDERWWRRLGRRTGRPRRRA